MVVGLDLGDTAQGSVVHSGSSSYQLNVGADDGENIRNSFGVATNSFVNVGMWGYGNGSTAPEMTAHAGISGFDEQSSKYTKPYLYGATTASWGHNSEVWSSMTNDVIKIRGRSAGPLYIDDIYMIELDDVSLTITPASETNSTENTDEIRVDGRDIYFESLAPSLTTSSGYVSFDWRPRHSAENAVDLAEGFFDDAYIFSADVGNYDYGKFNGAQNAATLVDPSKSWTTDQWVGYTIFNLGDGSSGIITANTSTQVTATLTGGAQNDWDRFEQYEITTNNNIRVYWDAANTLNMAYTMAGVSDSSVWDATSAIIGNSQYSLTLQYAGGQSMTLSVDGDIKMTLPSIPSAFGQAPNNAYFGSMAGTQQGDATFSEIVFDNVAPVVSITPLSPDLITDTTPSLSATATEEIASVISAEYQMDTTLGSWLGCIANDGSFDEATEDFTCNVDSPLFDGRHYMYIRATDSNLNTSEPASSSFTVDTTQPNEFSLEIPGDSDYIANQRPTFKFKAAPIPDATSDLSKYELFLDNGEGGDITIDNIPVSGTDGITTDERHNIYFFNFEDEDSTNNLIEVYTKSSSVWPTDQNDGLLKEGTRSWTVTAHDMAGNSRSISRTLFVDTTSPGLEDIIIEGGGHVSIGSTPTISGTITDNMKVGSVELSLYKQNILLGIETSKDLITSKVHEITSSTSPTSADFSFTPSIELDDKNYQVLVTGIDKAGNRSGITDLYIQTLTSKELEKQPPIEETTQDLKEPVKPKVSLPELEKKAKVRLTESVEETTNILDYIIAIIQKAATGVANTTSKFAGRFTGTNEALAKPFDIIALNLVATQKQASQGAKLAFSYISEPFIAARSLAQRMFTGTKLAVATFREYVSGSSEPTRIANVTLEEIGKDYVTISWETNHNTFNNKVNYGEDLSYGGEIWSDDNQKDHEVRIENLDPNTEYFFEVMSQGENYVYDAFYSFETLED